MLDYTLNSFHRSCFIISYDIDPDDKTIMVNYANNKSDIMPYTIENEKMILNRMRKQIIDGNNFYNRTTNSFKKLKFKDRLYKVLLTILLGIIIGLAIQNPLSCLLFLLLTLPSNVNIFRMYKKNSLDMWILNRTLKDYEKNIDFVNNSKCFSNEKVLKPYAITNMPDRVRNIITMGVIGDEYDKIVADTSKSSVLVDFQLFDEEKLNTNKEAHDLSIKNQKEAIQNGYKDLSDREIPFINENTINELTYQDLDELYKLTTSDKNKTGKVLIKTINFNRKK